MELPQIDVNGIVDGISLSFNDWVATQLTDNQFLIAAIFAGVSGALIWFLRSLAPSIFSAIKKRLSVVVTITSDDLFMNIIANELDRNSVSWLSRIKIFENKRMTIGYGRSVSRFAGKIVFVLREKEDSVSQKFKQTLTLTFPVSSPRKINDLFREFIDDFEKKSHDKITISRFFESDYSPSLIKTIPRRNVETVFLNEGVKENIINQIDTFLKSKKWYEDKSLPYKMSILLYGMPGTGKTSVAKMIASYTNRNIIITEPDMFGKISYWLNHDEDDDPNFPDHPSADSRESMILMEDIDSYSVVKDRDETEIDTDKGKFSVFLNSLDGVFSPDNYIMISTTNHIEKLDPAVLRKGRFDLIIELKPLNSNAIKSMLRHYVPAIAAEYESKTFIDTVGANVQSVILENINDDDSLRKAINKLLEGNNDDKETNDNQTQES